MSGITSIKPTHPAIRTYYEALKQFTELAAHHEGATETAFSRLLADTAKSAAAWVLVPKQGLKAGGKNIYPDGTLRDLYNLPRGYWEAKDTDDDLRFRSRKQKK
jgi:hypothetical protein